MRTERFQFDHFASAHEGRDIPEETEQQLEAEAEVFSEDERTDFLHFKKKVLAMKDLPSHRIPKKLGRELKPLSESAIEQLFLLTNTSETAEPKSESFTEKQDVSALIQEFFSGEMAGSNSFATEAKKIREWVEENEQERLPIIHQIITDQAKNLEAFNLPVLVLLGEIKSLDDDLLLPRDMVKAIELRSVRERMMFSGKTQDQLAALSRLNDVKATIVMHNILDFMQAHYTTAQISDEEDVEGVYQVLGPRGIHMQMNFLAKEMVGTSSNYLLDQHWKDLVQMREVASSEIPGVEGASADESLYFYRHVEKAYEQRVTSGIQGGDLFHKPVFDAAPGYVAQYAGSKVEAYYAKPRHRESIEGISQQYIDANAPEYDDIYETLNKSNSKYNNEGHNPSLGLLAIDDIRSFKTRLDRDEKEFFFDISRLEKDSLHPHVWAQILRWNDLYVQRHSQASPPETIAPEVFEKHLSPLRSLTEEESYTYRYLTSLQMRKRIEDFFADYDEEFSVANFSFWEQKQMLLYMEKATTEDMEHLRDLYLGYGIDGIRLLFAAEMDNDVANGVLEYFDARFDHVIRAFGDLMGEIQDIMESVSDERQQYELMDALMYRAKDLLKGIVSRVDAKWKELSADMEDNEFGQEDAFEEYDVYEEFNAYIGDTIDTWVGDIKRETHEQRRLSGMFREMLGLLEQHGKNTLDIRAYMTKYDQIMESLRDRGEMPLYLRALAQRGELAPVPEVHWRVDRGLDEYRRRFGFDLATLLEQLATKDDHRKVLVEFGAGSGQCKRERAALAASDNYIDVALVDRVYFPLNKTIEGVIDWGVVAEHLGIERGISPEDRALIADALYKLMVITDGELEDERFTYNERVLRDIADDPFRLMQIVRDTLGKLDSVRAIPSTISQHDEQGVYYPNKIDIADARRRSRELDQVMTTLTSDIDPQEIIPHAQIRDVYDAIPVDPSGYMVGDFSEIQKFADKQIDVAIGARSTVYKRGDAYVDFMIDVGRKLADGGVYIDDNIRDNDGWTYRLIEIEEALTHSDQDIQASILVGPGFENEDGQKGDVPLALVLERGAGQGQERIQALLDEGCSLVSFAAYRQKHVFDGEHLNEEELLRLDETGHLKNLAEAYYLSPAPDSPDDRLAA